MVQESEFSKIEIGKGTFLKLLGVPLLYYIYYQRKSNLLNSINLRNVW